MIRSRAAFRFWTTMSAAPAAVAAITSCGGGAGDPRPPEAPVTPLVVGSGSAAPLEISPPLPGEETAERAACAIDHHAASQCVAVQSVAPTKEGATDSRFCPKATSTSNLYSPFGNKSTARLDAEKTDEMGNGMCCYEWCDAIKVTRHPPAACNPPLYTRIQCIEMPERGTSAPAAAPFDRCPVGIVVRDLDGQKGSYNGRFEASASIVGDAGPARCCYAVCGPIQHRAVIGRPPRDGDDIAMAPAIASDAWRSGDVPRTRREIPLEDALLEHASVAAFARLSLSLLAFGAPPDLVARAHEAALDEIRHAKISFANAGGGQRGIGPGPCPAFAELSAHRSIAELAEETYVDGCVGETIASLKLRMYGDDETIVAMARDEERHAELAWRIVEWAIAVGGPEVRACIARVAEARSTNDDALARWAQANVIAPCTKALLSETA
jgi:hypothetical protein